MPKSFPLVVKVLVTVLVLVFGFQLCLKLARDASPIGGFFSGGTSPGKARLYFALLIALGVIIAQNGFVLARLRRLARSRDEGKA